MPGLDFWASPLRTPWELQLPEAPRRSPEALPLEAVRVEVRAAPAQVPTHLHLAYNKIQ